MGVIFPPFLIVLLSPDCYTTNFGCINNTDLLTIHGVVFLQRETEPLFLKKLTYN